MITTAELEAADRALCDLEESRARPVITASAWGLSTLCKDADARDRASMDAHTGRAGKDEAPPGPSLTP